MTDQLPELALYHFPSCGYCKRVRRVVDELGFDVELRDIRENPDYRAEIVEIRGRKTVPVLRIQLATGAVHWMPESKIIIEYLRGLHSGESKALNPAATVQVAERLSGRKRNLHLLLFILGVALALVAQLVAHF